VQNPGRRGQKFQNQPVYPGDSEADRDNLSNSLKQLFSKNISSAKLRAGKELS
jgi:hypothetical protein